MTNPDPIEDRDIDKLMRLLDHQDIQGKLFNLGFALRPDWALLPFPHQHHWQEMGGHFVCLKCDAYKLNIRTGDHV